MASNRSTKAKRASAADPPELRALRREAASEQAMVRQNPGLERSPGAVGPIGRMVLMVALLALVGLLAVWVLLAL